MEKPIGTIEVTLASRELLRLRDSKGCTVRVDAGHVWVTEEGKLRDAVLEPGALYTIGHQGLTLLNAFGDARVTINPAQAAGHRLELADVKPSPRSHPLGIAWMLG